MKIGGNYQPVGCVAFELHAFTFVLPKRKAEFRFSSQGISPQKQLLKLDVKSISWYWPFVSF